MATRAERIAELQSSILSAEEELEFLNDSGTFYDLSLGSGSKTILALDFTASDGIKRLSATDETKISSAWYQNYAGFTSAQEADAIETVARLKAYMNLQRIHQWVYPTGIDRAATGDDIFKWVISYDPIGDQFVPLNVGANSGVDAPASYQGDFYFKGTPANADAESADAQQAIDLMTDADDGTDLVLRELFGMVKPT